MSIEEKEKYKKWYDDVFTKIKPFIGTKKLVDGTLKLCSRHFKPECFQDAGTGPKDKLFPRRFLKVGSIPTENLPGQQSSLFPHEKKESENFARQSNLPPTLLQEKTDPLAQSLEVIVKDNPGIEKENTASNAAERINGDDNQSDDNVECWDEPDGMEFLPIPDEAIHAMELIGSMQQFEADTHRPSSSNVGLQNGIPHGNLYEGTSVEQLIQEANLIRDWYVARRGDDLRFLLLENNQIERMVRIWNGEVNVHINGRKVITGQWDLQNCSLRHFLERIQKLKPCLGVDDPQKLAPFIKKEDTSNELEMIRHSISWRGDEKIERIHSSKCSGVIGCQSCKQISQMLLSRKRRNKSNWYRGPFNIFDTT